MVRQWNADHPPETAPFFFTWTAQRTAEPLEVTGGEGAWIDVKGDGRWLDMAAFSYNVNLGHGHPRMIEAIKRQADRLCVAPPSAVYPAKTQLAEELLRIAGPGYGKVFFTLGGAEANENAIKMARMVTGRTKLVSRYRSYHGASLGALALTGDYRRPPLEPGNLPGVVRILDCDCHRQMSAPPLAECPHGSTGRLEQIFRLEGAGSIAAMFLEPIPGANGVRIPPKGYWHEARRVTEAHGALLVADEVLTGFGRTGAWLGVHHEGVAPDLITVAKGLTSGYGPLGAVIVHDRVAQHFDDNTLYCGLTGYAHPLSCAAGVEAIKIYRDEQLIDRAAALEAPLLAGFRAIADRFPDAVSYVRGRGLLAALDFSVDAAAMRRIVAALQARRILTHPRVADANLIVSPPLCISDEELALGVELIGDALRDALAG